MTAELQRAMARYEQARADYRVAVLASLRGTVPGKEIRSAIRECQSAGEEVMRLRAPSLDARRAASSVPVSSKAA